MTTTALTMRTDDAVAIRGTETNAAGAMARAQAEINAMYLVAERHPRSFDAVRQRLMRECERSTFAEVALYAIKRSGKEIKGPSIRFAEACRRIAGNMLASTATIYDGDDHQIIEVKAVDLETNAIELDQITVTKYVERKHVKQGDEVIGSRLNSYNEVVYKVRSTDDDFRVKRRAEAQRAKRNAILALIPGDIIEECVDRIERTRASKITADPDAARKRIVDGFGALNVPADQLARYLGHDLATASPDELLELQAVWVAVRDGEARWHEVLAAKTGVAGDADEKASALADKIASKKAELMKRKDKPAATAKASAPEPEEATTEPAPVSEPAKPKKVKAKKAEPEIPADVAAMMKAKGCAREDAEGYLRAGYEIDPASGEAVPPAGSAG